MLSKTELLELIGIGENSSVEFKRDDIRSEGLAKEVVAFANFRGGHILIGVEDDGKISGISRPDLETWVFNSIYEKVFPIITPHYAEISIDGDKRVAVITVDLGPLKPYVLRSNHRENIYIRMGSTSKLATRDQQAIMFAMGGMVHSELFPVSGSGLRDLSLERLKEYLIFKVGDTELPNKDTKWYERLEGLGYMKESETKNLVCTIAGLVLFGLSPRRFQRQAGIRWMSFPGEEKDYGALDDRIIDGPLVALSDHAPSGIIAFTENGLFENIIEAMRPFLSGESNEIDSSLRRKHRWHYPLPAIREALVNAMVHRDWTRKGEVEVVSYSNRLEIISPGPLPNEMTIEKMVAGQRSARNQLIVDVLRDYGYVDARGMGVRNKIIPLVKEYNGTKPEFQATEDYFKVVFYRGQKV